MTIYLDFPTRYPEKLLGETNARYRMGVWAHCWSSSEIELETLAERAGFLPSWIRKPKVNKKPDRYGEHKVKGYPKHSFYYITPGYVKPLLKLGAIQVNYLEWYMRNIRSEK